MALAEVVLVSVAKPNQVLGLASGVRMPGVVAESHIRSSP